ncbi:hypothetical protein GCK72_021527 [Caenorhabditis remanei]|uniref:Uncharacterized protein n=1 Tax=Caenorhabditis remanei TaxID=31234 RepID=A0A6A5GK34_CAERE|nr:hypothetical protein GCK72_021527 [Caenorhabditis remanei]KAF1754961.1 hypothetical protein GCK72_021527 [Caenorhabditis remanei]
MPTGASFGYQQCSRCNERKRDLFRILSENLFCSVCYPRFLKSQEESRCTNIVCQALPRQGFKLRTHPVTKLKICCFCYSYVYRYGRDREKVRAWNKPRGVKRSSQEEPRKKKLRKMLQSVKAAKSHGVTDFEAATTSDDTFPLLTLPMPTTVEVIKISNVGTGFDAKLDNPETVTAVKRKPISTFVIDQLLKPKNKLCI